MSDPQTLATFAATLPLLLVAHNLADHLTGQTHKQATTKGAPTPEQIQAARAAGGELSPHAGWGALLGHVAWYHLTLVVCLALAWWVLPVSWSLAGLLAGLGWSAVTHGFIDRRWPVRLLLCAMGKRGYAELASGGMNGLYQVDQALHHAMLLGSALMMAGVR